MAANGKAVTGEKRAPLSALPVVIAAAVLAVSVLSEAPARAPFTPCVFRNVTGLPCAGCGMTRAFVAVGHGRIGEAWRLHPFSLPLFAGLCVYVAVFLARAAGLRLPRPKVPPKVRWGVYVVLLVLVLGWWAVSIRRSLAKPEASPCTVRQWIERRASHGPEEGEAGSSGAAIPRSGVSEPG